MDKFSVIYTILTDTVTLFVMKYELPRISLILVIGQRQYLKDDMTKPHTSEICNKANQRTNIQMAEGQ